MNHYPTERTTMHTPHALLRRFASTLIATALLVVVLCTPPKAAAAIVSRSPGMAYDSTLNVTWATDGRLFDTLAAGMGGSLELAEAIYTNDPFVLSAPNLDTTLRAVPGVVGLRHAYLLRESGRVGREELPFPDFQSDPRLRRAALNWYGAQAFVNYLNDTRYLGYQDWRLPQMISGACVRGVNIVGSDCAGGPWNEVQSLYRSLGGQEDLPLHIPSGHNEAYELFSGRVGDGTYWLRDEMETAIYEVDEFGNFLGLSFMAGNFASALLADNGSDGDTFIGDKLSRFAQVMILRDGDSAPVTDAIGGNPVPLPAPIALLASGVVLVLTTRRRRERNPGVENLESGERLLCAVLN